jgi:hypothetical protein
MIENLNKEECDSIPQDAWQKLGCYVYALRDPRDNKIFYIGKGGGKEDGNSRVCSHFTEAEKSSDGSKLNRIRDIWANGEAVDWFIVRQNIAEDVALQIEATLIDTLNISQNGQVYNQKKGKNSALNGLLSSADLFKYGAAPVAPKNQYGRVFIFPVSNALWNKLSSYDAIRSAWSVGAQFRTVKPGDLAIGIDRGVSIGVFSVDAWIQVNNTSKYEFTSTPPENQTKHELFNKSFRAIINSALGYWQRGGYLVVEFDGNGNFTFLRGSVNTGLQQL